jgi:hypothetical protein
MTTPIIGDAHTYQRYIVFGIVAGIIAAYVAAVANVDLFVVAPVAGAIAALLAGKRPASGDIGRLTG